MVSDSLPLRNAVFMSNYCKNKFFDAARANIMKIESRLDDKAEGLVVVHSLHLRIPFCYKSCFESIDAAIRFSFKLKYPSFFYRSFSFLTRYNALRIVLLQRFNFFIHGSFPLSRV